MHQIPKPQTLDPDRPLRHRGTHLTEDDQPETELLATALQESCSYADQLWENLNAMRQYLLDSLPPDPRSPETAQAPAATSPTGPDDEAGWNSWINAFAAITSVLCGPQGDSGFGLSRAHEEAQARRSPPGPRLLAEQPPSRQPSHDNSNAAPQLPPPAENRPGEATRTAARQAIWTPTKTAAVLAVGALALRELRLHRSSVER